MAARCCLTVGFEAWLPSCSMYAATVTASIWWRVSLSGRPSRAVWKRPRPATKPTAGRHRAGWWWCAKRSANGPRRAGANCSRSPAIPFMSWSPPLGMTRYKPGSSTTAAPRAKNRIKELKEDFGAGGFCLHSFDGTETAFRLICFLFNLIADFKREVTQNEAPRLMTLRTRLLVVGAIRGADGRQQILRLGLRGRWRQRFAALLARLRALAVSTVAQFAVDQKNPVPRPWKPPPPRFQPPLLPALK